MATKRRARLTTGGYRSVGSRTGEFVRRLESNDATAFDLLAWRSKNTMPCRDPKQVESA